MEWLLTIDQRLFRCINIELSNSFFDSVMPPLSGNSLFVPLAALAAVALAWKGRTRGVICIFMLILVTAIGDGFICRTVKAAVARPRPYVVIPEARMPKMFGTPSTMDSSTPGRAETYGKSAYRAMPSSHAANWFAGAMVMLIYYRRSGWAMLPAAALVSYSRIYNGAHFPSDILVAPSWAWAMPLLLSSLLTGCGARSGRGGSPSGGRSCHRS
jgi:undecaprenyl-diphosphatase